MADDDYHQIIDLIISFRGSKIEIPLSPTTSLSDIKSHLSNSNPDLRMTPQDIKLIHKGRVVQDANESPDELFTFFSKSLKKKKQKKSPESLTVAKEVQERKIIRLMATGFSPTEMEHVERSKENAPRVRDDISNTGKRETLERKRLGRKMMIETRKKTGDHIEKQYGFGRIETLPMLPEQDKAKEILHSLANDPGILACMAKRQWNVGCLGELFPEGKVGESAVCVMGLNENKGARILLRLRTDDLSGFRKILNIRKVLFHELAHNVHSEHNGEFFQLMREVEKECNEMDWTQGAGLGQDMMENNHTNLYQGGIYRLGEKGDSNSGIMTQRDRAARAAMMRMSKEEQEIQEACGCGNMVHSPDSNLPVYVKSKTASNNMKDTDGEGD